VLERGVRQAVGTSAQAMSACLIALQSEKGQQQAMGMPACCPRLSHTSQAGRHKNLPTFL